MNEVSARANALLLQMLAVSGVSAERLVDGLPVALDELRDPSRRFSWDLHADLIDRVSDLLGGPEALERVGRQVPAFPQLAPVRALGGSLLHPSRIYWMACRWLGPAHFAHITYDFEDLGDGSLRIAVSIPDTHRPSPAFFHITRGTLRRGPLLLGMHEEAEVAMDLDADGRRAVYRVRLPRRRSLWGALGEILGLSSTASEAVEILADEQSDLNRRYGELVRAEEAVERRDRRLRTIGALSRALLEHVESEGGTDGLLRFLRDRFAWKGAALWLVPTGGGEARLVCASGLPGGVRQRHGLRAAGRAVGHLEVWTEAPADAEDLRLLGQLLPWLSVALAKDPPAPEAGHHLEAFRWTGDPERELFLIVDADGVVRYAGATVERILGLDQGAILSREIADLLHPDDLPGLQETFTSFAERPGSAAFRRARLRHADGSWRVLEGVGIKVQDEQGRPVFMFSTSDVTDRTRAH